jgi:hypothetical protein
MVDDPLVLDERTFMQECADRLNGFLRTYPREAQHVLTTFVEYEHELLDVHRNLRRLNRAAKGLPPEEDEPEPGTPMASLICAILQTHHGTGYYLRPRLSRSPDGDVIIEKLEVASQDEMINPMRD